MSHTVTRFAAGLKKRLRTAAEANGPYDYRFVTHEEGHYWSTLTGSDPCEVSIDWPALDAEIDAFCAEFKAGKS